ncbi:MAG: ribosome silencing factor [Alphaproteobacteria bacterium]|nr:MAG: ribosome silencing factor [Alphaproteobacteria bacterium]
MKADRAVVANLRDLVEEILHDDKAEELVSIDLAGKTSFADYMIIANGRSSRQVTAMADHLKTRIKEAGFGSVRVEGQTSGDWILVDAGDVVVHLFRPEVRNFYNLEKIWAPDIPMEMIS